MVEQSYVETLQKKAPYIENIEKGILDSLFDPQYDESGTFIGFGDKGLLSSEQFTDPTSSQYMFGIPDYQIAGMDPLQTQVLNTLGSTAYQDRFKPFFQSAAQFGTAGSDALKEGLGLVDDATKAFETGTETIGDAETYFDPALSQVKKGVGAFDPSEQIKAFMDPYQQNVIDVAMKELDKQGAKAEQRADAEAISRGAFGSGRAGLGKQELANTLYDAKADALSKLLSSGYKTALASSMDAFEKGKRRDLESGRLMGGLGASLGNLGLGRGQLGAGIGKLGGIAGGLGQGFGQLGGIMGDVGKTYGALTANDLNAMATAGAQKQSYDQAVLDAYRANQFSPLKSALMPLSIGQQFLSGSPTAGTTSAYQTAYQPSPNPFLQGVGAATAFNSYYQ